ncbi:DUF3025 domain-containing protein [Glaciecola siphonariae]|uniref:DUF3025 domain-containing protein n=1 Tax=Glaciecola siphonariae TaxID=521012 RepID=UPI0036D33F76
MRQIRAVSAEQRPNPANAKPNTGNNLAYTFVCQDSAYKVDENKLDKEQRYYEEIIFQDKCIPTRSSNLHDYFNGLVWLQYPKTKAYLNQLHWHEIQGNSLKKRSPLRDRVTHFDECGIVLVTDLPDLKASLKGHDWQDVYVDKREHWFRPKHGIVPLHFGHANLEMLCKPFIGLTAKAMVINSESLLEVACSLLTHKYASESESLEKTALIDEALVAQLKKDKIFSEKGHLMPLPLLGIPGWHFEEQTSAFYRDQNYFMPHPSQRGTCDKRK